MRVYVLAEQGKIRTQLLELLLEGENANEIESFENFNRFIDRIGKSPPDFCFIRLGQDGIPGLTVAGEVQRICQDIRVVFISEDGRFAVDAYDVGACGYLTCPLDREKLKKCISKLK